MVNFTIFGAHYLLAGIVGSFRIYDVGGKMLSAIKSFYEEASACVKISGETREHFEIKVAVQSLYGGDKERREKRRKGS